MPTFRPNPFFTVSAPVALHPTGVELTWSVGGGWDWSVETDGEIDIDHDPESEYRITINDGLGAVIQSPALVALDRSTDGGTGPDRSALSGIDLTTARLGRDQESFSSFKGVDSTVIAAAVADRAGVTISGFPSFYISEEEIKFSKLADGLDPLAEVAGVEHFVNPDGSLQYVNVEDSAGTLLFPHRTRKRTTTPWSKKTKMAFGKRSSVHGGGQGSTPEGWQTEVNKTFDSAGAKSFALPNPLSHIVAADLSTIGYVDLIGFWEGDPASSGKLISFARFDPNLEFELGVVPTGSWPATHVTCMVQPSSGFPDAPIQARLRMIGSPPSPPTAGVDPEFYWEYDTGATPPRAASPLVTTIIPSKTYIQARAPYILWLRSKGWDTVELEGPLWCNLGLRDRWTWPGGGPTFQVDSVSWRLPVDGEPTTSISLVRVP